MSEVVTGYLDALGGQDWGALAATLTDGEFERIGPFCDAISGTPAYLAFLEGIVSTLGNYAVGTRRLSQAGSTVYAEVTESFELEGRSMAFPEVLVFELDAAGLINRVEVYMMRPGETASVPGGSAAPRGGGTA